MSFDTSQASYQALRNIVAERTNGIVFWTGSGLSAEVGLPTWPEFKSALVTLLQEEIGQLDHDSSRSPARVIKLITDEDNNWVAFEMLKEQLGPATWTSHIREILRHTASMEAPSIYKKIWSLEPHGLLTLNLDRLATRAYTEVRPGRPLTEFTGNQAGAHSHVLRSPHPFVCHLHGDIDDASSWILTRSELQDQQKHEGYQNFVRSCLSAKTIVFLGLSADDVSVGGYIEQLADLGIDVGAHYWITPRRDLQTYQWAEKRGVRLIRYDASGSNHSDLIDLFDDLLNFVSVDDLRDTLPLLPTGLSVVDETLPIQEELLAQNTETIREGLNREATRILSTSSPSTTDEYIAFSRAYDEAIYRAWYTSAESEDSSLLGHILQEEVASGAFGRVYRATDSEGNNVAVKVLHEEIRRNPDLLHSFRRGVRSMKILSYHDVQGMVPYRKAYEIPAFVVMDWIDGPDLGTAVSSMHVQEWELILRIGSGIADVVRRGHVLPERVLHRDIRPSNVMLRGFYNSPYEWDVVVLDFDLSWHRGALERSVTHGSNLLGYLAPEQIQDIPDVSTRHAAVDSFGLGMVLFFMMSNRDPVPDEHLHTDWRDTLMTTANTHPSTQWYSAPMRFARLIDFATQHNQSERWDMTQIQAELQRLYEAVLDPTSPRSAELIAEEIAARCEFTRGYEWDSNLLAAVKEEPSGIRVVLRGDESLGRVNTSLYWGDPGVQGRRHLGKWIGPAAKSAVDILKSFGWRIQTTGSRYAHISISAYLPARTANKNMSGVVQSLDRALDQLRFS